MCGIAGIYIKRPGHPIIPDQEGLEYFVNELMLGIEHRGRDATGVVSAPAGASQAKLEKAAAPASEFVLERGPLAPDPRIVMCHTRLATKGIPDHLVNNHPVNYQTTFVTHNGHIRNDDELFEKNKEELPRIGEVDSMVISALFYKHGIDKAHLALQELDGGFAVAVFDPVQSPDTLLLAKGPSSPLVICETPYVIVWASVDTAIKRAWWNTFKREPKKKWFSELKSGQIKIIKGEETEDLTFELFRKPYSYQGSPSPYSYGHQQSWPHRALPQTTTSQGSEDLEDDWWEKRSSERREHYSTLCVCGETQWWHAGNDYTGRCIKSTSTCEGFKAVASCDTVTDLSGSGLKTVTVLDTTKYQSEYRVYDSARKESIVMVLCVGCDTKVEKVEALDVCGYYMCRQCQGSPETPEQREQVLNEQMELDGDPFGAAVLEQVAKELQLSVAYVSWLLFESEDEDFDREVWLVNAYCTAEDLYQRRMKEMMEEEQPDECGVQAFAETEDLSDDEDEEMDGCQNCACARKLHRNGTGPCSYPECACQYFRPYNVVNIRRNIAT